MSLSSGRIYAIQYSDGIVKFGQILAISQLRKELVK